ncbi:MAG: OmpA family protein [Myxococcota bacterium]
MAKIRVHIDTLEYTRDGLATKEPIPLHVGEHNEVVLVRPERRKALPFGTGAFGQNSCFPTPGVLSVCMRAAAQNQVNLILGLNPTSIFQVYGHADLTGNDATNKQLSNKRAEVVAACLVGDFVAVQQRAAEEEWGLREHQIMLRSLKCDPGAIDGENGPVTSRAVALFQHEYEHGVFHRHLADTKPQETLPQDGSLSEATVRALIEAYVLCTSPRLTPEQVHPSHPAVGCGATNLFDRDQDEMNRRVSLVVHPELPPHFDAAPCTKDSHDPCPIDDRDERSRCLWYREHVVDPSPAEIEHRLFDLRWLPLPNGHVLLSALTTLPDESDVEFEVFRTQPLGSLDEIRRENLAAPMSKAMPGVVRGGVAQVVWAPADDLRDPLAAHTEHRNESGEPRTAAEHFENPPRVSMPIFTCRGGGTQELSKPPGRELVRMPGKAGVESEDRASGFTGIDWFGGVYQVGTHENARDDQNLHPLREEEVMIERIGHIDHSYGDGGSQ